MRRKKIIIHFSKFTMLQCNSVKMFRSESGFGFKYNILAKSTTVTVI